MMSATPTSGGRRRWPLWLALALIGVGVALVIVAVSAQKSAPSPPRAVGHSDAPRSRSGGASPSRLHGGVAAAHTGKPPLAASPPRRITIPSIGVDSGVIRLGLAPDGTLAVPQPGPNLNKAAWFENSPTPGQVGPAIIEGHVDSESGPSVFFRLGSIRPGNHIVVTRADGVRLTFTVNAVRDYLKTKFPTDVVYGSDDLSRSQLRLITCSDFDPVIRHHVGNEVVFAHLTATHEPSPGGTS
jgi:sortase (surface protein transpeptidase)